MIFPASIPEQHIETVNYITVTPNIKLPFRPKQSYSRNNSLTSDVFRHQSFYYPNNYRISLEDSQNATEH